VVVKSVSPSASIEPSQIETEIENLLNLRHPMIAPLIGFAFPAQSSGRRELKTARLHAAEGPLAAVLFGPPASWTPTARAKAVAGIALPLRFAHRLAPLHGPLKASNVLFDADRRTQITGFRPTRLDTRAVQPFSDEGGRRLRTFPCVLPFFLRSRFVALPFRLSVQQAGHPSLPSPVFASPMIENGRAPQSQRVLSFAGIVERLKENHFQILAGVDSEEVAAWVSWAESAEQSGKWEKGNHAARGKVRAKGQIDSRDNIGRSERASRSHLFTDGSLDLSGLDGRVATMQQTRA
jgi:hypothetical protein